MRTLVALALLLLSTEAFGATVVLNWNPSTGSVTSYKIYRDGFLIGTSTTINYTDVTVTTGVHNYTISAVDAVGNESVQSAPVSITVVTQVAGPSATLYANPYYRCSNNRYVSPTGTFGNDGLTAGKPWSTDRAVLYVAPAGTCINLAPGVYTTPIRVDYGGTNSTRAGYVVWRCTTMPFSFSGGVLQGQGTGCVFRNSTEFNIVSVNPVGVSYVMFDALEVDGQSAVGGICINVDSRDGPPAHHIWITNSVFHGCGQSGASFYGTDWIFALHNVFHHNSNISGFMGSGFSIYQPLGLPAYTPTLGNPDYWVSATTGLTYKIVIAYNVSYHNFNAQSVSGNTDGNGIIIDDYGHTQRACPSGTFICPTTSPTLVMGNIVYNNGGGGIQIVFGNSGGIAPVTVVNNTAYSNNWDTFNPGTWRGGILAAEMNNIKIMNNISVDVRAGGITANNSPYVAQQNGRPCPTGNVWANNLSAPAGHNNFDGGSCNTYPTPSNVDNGSAGFTTTSTATPNFALQAGSVAIGLGQAFDLWQQSGTVDAGACARSAPGPVTNCP